MIQCRWAIFVLLLMPLAAQAAEPADSRQAVAVTAAEKAYILEQMRLFIGSIQTIAEGLSTGDNAKVAEAAAARGRRANANDPHFPAGLGAKLPPLWKQMGGGIRGGFDELADAAKSGAPKEKSLGILAATMRNCVACHQSFRLVDVDH
jgi:cytochrome c556